MKLPIGVSDFKELVTEGYQFADKTLFIKDIIEDGSKVILITRPRRFGKTLNLSMLQYFLDCNQQSDINLFANLLISQDQEFCAKHQNKYPVIFVTFKGAKKDTFDAAYAKIVSLISNLYQEHRYLLEDDILFNNEKTLFNEIIEEKANQTHIENSIVMLAKYMARKFKQLPMVLIDEYDTPIQEAYLNDYYPEMLGVMRSLLGETLKDSKIYRAIVTGITRVAQESLFSGVNNFSAYSLLREKYSQYFGFTENEVLKLLSDHPTNLPIKGIKEWYNGYQVGKYILYNPWSILSCLDYNGELKAYWLNTATNGLIKKLLDRMDYTAKGAFELLLQGKTIEKPLLEGLVFPELEEKEEAIWSLLLYAGYLNVISTEVKDFDLMAKIAIPNHEVMYVYNEIVAGWFRKGGSLSSYKQFIASLKAGDMDEFKRYLGELLSIGSYFDFNTNTPEKVFHSFMLGLTVGLKDEYVIQSNQEAGKGRFDVIFIPKDKNKSGILLEFKIAKTVEELTAKAQEALAQIKDKQYLQAYRQQEVTNVLVIGMAFCGKVVELAHEDIML